MASVEIADDLQVVEVRLRRSWAILARCFLPRIDGKVPSPGWSQQGPVRRKGVEAHQDWTALARAARSARWCMR